MSFTYIVNKFVASILALIVAFVTPAGAVAPSAPARVNRNLPVVQVQEEAQEEPELVEEPTEEPGEEPKGEAPDENENNMGDAALNTVLGLVGENNEEPAGEPEEPAEEPEEEPEAEEPKAPEAVKVWNVSDTDEDDVQMYYYREEPSLLENLAETVKAVFLPITAYADTRMEDGEEEGTIIIQGTGATEEALFLKWLDADAFVPAYEAWCEEMEYEDEAYIRFDYVDRNTGDYYGDLVSGDVARGDYDDVDLGERTINEALLDDYFPANICEFAEVEQELWESLLPYAPKHIIIQGGVTEINFAAFAFCTFIESITITAPITEIGAGAFQQTGIKKLILPETVRAIRDGAFFKCENLMNVYLKGAIPEMGEWVFSFLPEGSKVYCESDITYDNFVDETEDQPMTFGLMPNEEISTNYSYNTRIILDPDVFENLE